MKGKIFFLLTIVTCIMFVTCESFDIYYSNTAGLSGEGTLINGGDFTITESGGNGNRTREINRTSVQYDPENDFIFEIMDDGRSIEITQYVGNKREVYIPLGIQKMPITMIGERAFAAKRIWSVTIPIIITSIGDEAFAENYLIRITIGAGVLLGYKSFDNGFDDFYNSNGRKSGTYAYIRGRWRME